MVFGLCMDSDVFIRLFGGFTGSGGGQSSLLHSGSSNPILFLLTVTLVGVGFFAMLPIHRPLIRTLLAVPWFLALYAECLVSVLWSVQPSDTFRYGVTLWAYLACTLVFTYYVPVEEATKVVGNTVFALAILSLILEFVSPVRGAAPGWTGIYGEKNHFGIGMTIGMLAIAVPRERWTFFRVFKIAFMFGLLIMSQSATAFICTIFAGYLLALFRSSPRSRKSILVIPVALSLIAFVLVPHFLDRVLAAGGKNTTLTGRDAIWGFVLQQIKAKPLLGWGYTAFWNSQGDLVVQNLNWNPQSAHNGFLETALSLGILGIIITLGILWMAFRHAFFIRRKVNELAGTWLILSLAVLLLHDMTETDFLIPAPLWFMFTVSYFAALRAWAPLRSRAAVQAPGALHIAGRPALKGVSQ